MNFHLKYEKLMQSARRNVYPATPNELIKLHEILEEYQPFEGIYRGCGVGADGSLALIFISESMIPPLSVCSQLFGDGTLKVIFFLVLKYFSLIIITFFYLF